MIGFNVFGGYKTVLPVTEEELLLIAWRNCSETGL